MRAWPLALAVVLVPAVAAQEGEPLCIITVTPAPDWRSVDVVVDLVLTPGDLDNLTREVDADRDRNITLAEVEAYEGVDRLPALDGSERAERSLFLDGKPMDLRLRRNLTGFEGPAEPRPGMKVAEVRHYLASSPAEQRWHNLDGGLAAARRYAEKSVVVETVVITAPEGWLVWDVNRTAVRAAEATFRGFDTRGEWQARFALPGTEPGDTPWPPERIRGGPGPPEGLVAAVAVLVGLAWRRRA